MDQRNADAGDPDVMYRSGRDVWGPQLMTHRADLTAAQIEAYLHALYRTNPDFAYKSCGARAGLPGGAQVSWRPRDATLSGGHWVRAG